MARVHKSKLHESDNEVATMHKDQIKGHIRVKEAKQIMETNTEKNYY